MPVGKAGVKRRDPFLRLAEAGERDARVVYLSYRAPEHEAGPEKQFDFSQATLADRWQAGSLDMAEALRLAKERGRSDAGLSIRWVRR